MPTLNKLTLSNFKCFRRAAFELGPLTLLAGMNGAGKSSLIQSLLLLRQSFLQETLQDGRLALNGDLARVGSSQDALFEDADPEVISFSLEWSDQISMQWSWQYSHSKRTLEPEGATVAIDAIANYLPFANGFFYLTADRVSSGTFSQMTVRSIEDLPTLGVRGEFTPHFLAAYRDERLRCPNLRRENAQSDSFLHQVEAWLNAIRPGMRIEVKMHDFMDLVELSYQFQVGRNFGNPFRPTNVGFGLTYVLPVIVALLAAPPGGMVIIENPEAHLHPRGQSQIGALCARAAAEGVQVIVETHSDHVLNGIRVAVREGSLSPDAVAVHFFSISEDPTQTTRSEFQSPKLDSDGRFDEWPSGFFDEWDHALDRLLE